MSSDEESINKDPEVSDNEQNNEILEIGEDLEVQEEQTEEVQRDENAEGEEGGENVDGEKKVVKPKRVIRNPQPKLNEETLKGPRGIAALESYFQRVKFKGKGKESEDLEVIMKTYEYWCHRLFPKFPFDTCIERLEKLGNKRAVQTHIKRIRFDLLIEDKPILDDSDKEPNVEGFVDIQHDEINQQQNQQFDQLLGFSTSAPISTHVDLTEEQLERIRLNKERAERLRQERLKKIKDKAGESLQISSQLPGTSGLRNEIGLELSEVAGSTQSDIFSQEDYPSESRKNTNVLNEIGDTEAIFDHESNLKGKTNVKGASIKKRPKKRTSVFKSDSENSSDDNVEDKVQNDVDENSSDSGFAPKKKNKQNAIYDSDDDQSIDAEYKKHEDSRSGNSDNADDNLHNVEKSISNKTLLDTYESDQEMEETGQSSKEIDIRKESRGKPTDSNSDHRDQEIDTNQAQLSDSLSIDGFREHSINLESSGQKTNSSTSQIFSFGENNTKMDNVATEADKRLNSNNVQLCNNKENTPNDLNKHSSDLKSSGIPNSEKTNIVIDNLDTLTMATEMEKHSNNVDETMESIEGELEAVLKSTQDKNVVNR